MLPPFLELCLSRQRVYGLCTILPVFWLGDVSFSMRTGLFRGHVGIGGHPLAGLLSLGHLRISVLAGL